MMVGNVELLLFNPLWRNQTHSFKSVNQARGKDGGKWFSLSLKSSLTEYR